MRTVKPLNLDEAARLVKSFGERKMLVAGDLVADQFLYGEISRVSREAPVLILRHERTETVPGGAANCAMNLASLGAGASIVGVVGNDESGRSLLQTLRSAGVNCDCIEISKDYQTPTKVRILAGHAHSSRQQVIRVDHESGAFRDQALQSKLAENLSQLAKATDAIIISDYNYGVASNALLDAVRSSQDRPVLIDSRSRLKEFKGFSAATPNEDEVEQILEMRFENRDQLAGAAERLRKDVGLKALLVTRGRHGMILLEEGESPLFLDAVGELDAVDVTGAGDTVISTFGLAIASGASFSDAALLANHAGGVVVMKRGTATVTPDELQATIREHST
jgi:D-glycero-beta-D-manno-heptose-7-phosphate kinase